MSRDHRRLRVFELADDLVVRLYRETGTLSGTERYGLQAQLRRSGVSVAANLVEGCARATAAEYRRFIEIAHGSARECAYLLRLATRLALIDGRELADSYDHLAAALLSLSYSIARNERKP